MSSPVALTPITRSESSSPMEHHARSPSSVSSAQHEDSVLSPLLPERDGDFHDYENGGLPLPSPSRSKHRRVRSLAIIKTVTRHPLFPVKPLTIFLALSLIGISIAGIVFQLKYYLRSHKEPLPWRTYCREARPFPPSNFDSIQPVSLFVAIFSMDSGYERRMMIRNSYASSPMSRIPGTERTVVRFIIGQPRKEWERRVGIEMDLYNDIVVLPIAENMNDGKTYHFYLWAYSHAFVPPPPNSSLSPGALETIVPLAPHDPQGSRGVGWVKPDYIVKADEDSFIMLGELEARLRTTRREMTYWGFIVRKERFMAGESYALSFDLVRYIATTKRLRTMIKGAEDQMTALWMKSHPRAEEIRWWDERCWIYDYPKSGTIFSHGLLFPSEVERIRQETLSPRPPRDGAEEEETPEELEDPSFSTVSRWKNRYSYSADSSWASRYVAPHTNLTVAQSIEALVEGSEMSLVRPDASEAELEAVFHKRESRTEKYKGKRVGGTVVVHYVKRNEYWLECEAAFLSRDESDTGKQS